MTPDQFQAERQKQIRETFARLGTISGTARELKAHKKTVRKALAATEPADPPAAPSFTIAPLPSGDVPVEELIRSKVERFSRKRDAELARDRIVVKINEAGPVVIPAGQSMGDFGAFLDQLFTLAGDEEELEE